MTIPFDQHSLWRFSFCSPRAVRPTDEEQLSIIIGSKIYSPDMAISKEVKKIN